MPTIPRHINVTFVNQSAVELRWLPPAITGDQTDVYYDVDCQKPFVNNDDNECLYKECESIVTYLPRKEGLNVSHVMVTNLSPFVNYAFKIYAKNRVSEVARRRHGVEGNYTAISLRTNGSSKFFDFYIMCNILSHYLILLIVLSIHRSHSDKTTLDFD